MPTQTKYKKWGNLERALKRDGFEVHTDNILKSAIAYSRPCDCGERFVYRGFKCGQTFRAFAVCPSCNEYFEF